VLLIARLWSSIGGIDILGVAYMIAGSMRSRLRETHRRGKQKASGQQKYDSVSCEPPRAELLASAASRASGIAIHSTDSAMTDRIPELTCMEKTEFLTIEHLDRLRKTDRKLIDLPGGQDGCRNAG
jgi:hypothetical protein